jgi:hypothetical protein
MLMVLIAISWVVVLNGSCIRGLSVIMHTDVKEAEFSIGTRSDVAESTENGFRARELAWRKAHLAELEKYVEQWLALEGEQILAVGKDPASVITAARAKGCKVPYIFQVSPKQLDVIAIGL